jgi:hypothetical protein
LNVIANYADGSYSLQIDAWNVSNLPYSQDTRLALLTKTSLLANGRKRDSSMELLEWKDEFYIFVKTLNPT